MRIGIDARLSGHKNAGIGRYVENLLLRLPLLSLKKPAVTWVYFFDNKTQLADLMVALGQIKLPTRMTVQNFFEHIEIVYAPIKHYSLQEQTRWPKILGEQQLDLLHVPHFNVPIFYQGALVVTIHDLLWHEKKGLHVTTLNPITYYLKYFFYRLVTRSAVQKARRIFVPARTVAQTVIRYYPHAQNKILVTPEGFYQTQPAPLPAKIANQLPTAPFLLYVGSLYPHKNIDLVLQALKLPAAMDWHLVIVGARDVFLDKVQKKVQNLELSDRVHLLGFVQDAQLATLYGQALALVQPSLSEGFGLTGLEAMNLGAPVLASNIPIFHEVYGQAALYFDPHQAESLLKQIHKLLPSNSQSTTLRRQLQKNGHQQAQLYDWQQMASQTWAGYLQVLSLTQ